MAFRLRLAVVAVLIPPFLPCAHAQTATTTETGTTADTLTTMSASVTIAATTTAATATAATTTSTGTASSAAAAAADASEVAGGLRKGEAVLYLHLICMGLAWAACIPAGIALVTLLRGVPAAQDSRRLRLHVRFQCAGWLLSLLGLVAAVVYCELHSSHFASTHARIGFGVVAVAELQPLSAAIRPAVAGRHCCARAMFVLLHKCMGYAVVLLGVVNLGLGTGLVYSLGYDENVLQAASGVVAFGMLPVLAFGLLACCRRKNALSRWLVEPTRGETAAAAELAAKAQRDLEENARAREQQEEEAVAKAFEEQRRRQHAYKVLTMTKPTWCGQCKRFMWGFAGQGYHCVKCHSVACPKCVLLDAVCPDSAKAV